MYVKVSVKMPIKSFENPDPAVAYHFCLSLPIELTQPGQSLLPNSCTGEERVEFKGKEEELQDRQTSKGRAEERSFAYE